MSLNSELFSGLFACPNQGETFRNRQILMSTFRWNHLIFRRHCDTMTTICQLDSKLQEEIANETNRKISHFEYSPLSLLRKFYDRMPDCCSICPFPQFHTYTSSTYEEILCGKNYLEVVSNLYRFITTPSLPGQEMFISVMLYACDLCWRLNSWTHCNKRVSNIGGICRCVCIIIFHR